MVFIFLVLLLLLLLLLPVILVSIHLPHSPIVPIRAVDLLSTERMLNHIPTDSTGNHAGRRAQQPAAGRVAEVSARSASQQRRAEAAVVGAGLAGLAGVCTGDPLGMLLLAVALLRLVVAVLSLTLAVLLLLTTVSVLLLLIVRILRLLVRRATATVVLAVLRGSAGAGLAVVLLLLLLLWGGTAAVVLLLGRLVVALSLWGWGRVVLLLGCAVGRGLVVAVLF